MQYSSDIFWLVIYLFMINKGFSVYLHEMLCAYDTVKFMRADQVVLVMMRLLQRIKNTIGYFVP
jgi:hypothetical protein